jgi:hypothetical protein
MQLLIWLIPGVFFVIAGFYIDIPAPGKWLIGALGAGLIVASVALELARMRRQQISKEGNC